MDVHHEESPVSRLLNEILTTMSSLALACSLGQCQRLVKGDEPQSSHSWPSGCKWNDDLALLTDIHNSIAPDGTRNIALPRQIIPHYELCRGPMHYAVRDHISRRSQGWQVDKYNAYYGNTEIFNEASLLAVLSVCRKWYLLGHDVFHKQHNFHFWNLDYLRFSSEN